MTRKLRVFELLAICIAAATVATATTDSRRSGAEPASIALSSMETRCPTAVVEEKRVDMQFYSGRPREKAPTNPALRTELLQMAHKDQEARIALIRHGMSDPEYIRRVKEIDAENEKPLKEIFKTYGFPTPAMVGYGGTNAAWLLLQHQDQDPAWQRRWLKPLTQLAKRHELSPEDYALFVDRVRVNEGRKQIYGTQFFDGGFVMKPTISPGHLDERREAIGLIPEKEYECILRAMYNSKQAKRPR